MNRKSKDQWIDETLGGFDGMQRASAPATLHARVMARIGAAKPKRITLPRPMVWAAAAGFLLLVSLNGLVLLHHRGVESLSHAGVSASGARPDGAQREGNPLVDEYFAPTGIL